MFEVPVEYTNVRGLGYLLASCVQELRAEDSDGIPDSVIEHMMDTGLLPHDGLPGATHRSSHTSSSARADGDAEDSRSKRQKIDNNHRTDWGDVATATWRQEARIEHSRHRRRWVKVFMGKTQGWGDLEPEEVAAVLQFYDAASIFDILPNIPVTIEGETYHVNYRYEGGSWLTQRNYQRTGNPRACQVYYMETQ